MRSVTHHIQKYIIDQLAHVRFARFRDLRPPRTDTNLFTYHLNILVKAGFVLKTEKGYSLTLNGLKYVDRTSSASGDIRLQPKIVTMLVVQNSRGDILLQKRHKQPFIDHWTLPHGKTHLEDKSVYEAAVREAEEKLGVSAIEPIHVGACYIRTHAPETTLVTLAHVFRFNSDDIKASDTLLWARPHKLSQLELAPAVEEIMTRTFFNDPFYFEEYDVTWSDDSERAS